MVGGLTGSDHQSSFTATPQMASTDRIQQLAGIIPPLVTPLLNRDRLDVTGTQALLDHVIEGGVSAVFILGTTGEAPSLGYELRREMISVTCQHVAGRIPVLVGVTDTAFTETVSLSDFAEKQGAAGLVFSTPYYFPAGQTELKQYVLRLLPELSLPVLLYNMPSLTKVWFEAETLAELATQSQIVGIKDSSGDLDYFHKVAQLRNELRPDWRLFVGPEHLLVEAMDLGANGGVNGGANIFPQLFSRLYLAKLERDETSVRELLNQVIHLQQIYDVGKYASRFIKATKSALSIRNICSDHMAEPFNHFLAPERAKVAEILAPLENEWPRPAA